VIIELESKFIADAIGLRIHAPISQKIAKALGLILSIVMKINTKHVPSKVNGETGHSGPHAHLHVEEALKIEPVPVLFQTLVVGSIQKRKLVINKLVQPKLH